jgi:hypothetical protein
VSEIIAVKLARIAWMRVKVEIALLVVRLRQ